MAPLIGITTYGRDAEDRYYLRATYIDAVRRAGGMPALLPPGEPRALELLARLDGLILAGGGDIDPALYGGSAHETIYMVDPDRDGTELALARQAVTSRLPTLGICRGSQVLNVALGGSLIEHLPDEVGETVLHRTADRQPILHPVTIVDGSRLGRILGDSSLTAASWHHQAVRRLAPGLEVVARAADGVIEAFEIPSHPWLVAVQWHPELRAAEDPAEQRIFDELIKAAISQERNHA